MYLFSLGPVAMYQYTLEVAGHPIPYFRTPEFSQLMLESEKMMKQVIFAEESCKTVFLTASGTGAMEATIMNCFSSQDKVLIIDGGIFGHRFVEICELHKIPYRSIPLGFGEVLTEEHLSVFAGKGYTALLVNIHETSTGQLYDIQMLSSFCKVNNLYFIVDAISSFMADQYKMAEWGIDCTILSSQKGLAIAPGMAVVVVSERLFTERVLKNKCPCMYFDFADHINNLIRGQTPFTPAVNIAFQLNDMLHHILKESVEARLEHVTLLASDFRRKLLNVAGIGIPTYPLSNASTPLLFLKENASEVYDVLKNKYEIILTPCGGNLKNSMLRVAHIGNHCLDENIILIKALQEISERVG